MHLEDHIGSKCFWFIVLLETIMKILNWLIWFVYHPLFECFYYHFAWHKNNNNNNLNTLRTKFAYLPDLRDFLLYLRDFLPDFLADFLPDFLPDLRCLRDFLPYLPPWRKWSPVPFRNRSWFWLVERSSNSSSEPSYSGADAMFWLNNVVGVGYKLPK